jgi:hypothetical protein
MSKGLKWAKPAVCRDNFPFIPDAQMSEKCLLRFSSGRINVSVKEGGPSLFLLQGAILQGFSGWSWEC